MVSLEVAKPTQMSRSALGRDVEAMANSAIGNGFHLPSVMLFMFLLLQGVEGEEQQMQSPNCGIGVAAGEEDLRRRIAGTVFDENVLKSTQGILRPREIIHQLRDVILTTPDQDKKAAIQWIKVASNLRGAETHLLQLQLYWAYRERAGWFGVALGPSWQTQQQQAKSYARLGIQRAAASSRRGLLMLMQPGLGPEEHMLEAQKLESPFRTVAWPDDDIAFAAEAIAVWGPVDWSLEAKADGELCESLAGGATPGASAAETDATERAKVPGSKNPAFMAICIIALRWPDRHLPMEYLRPQAGVGHLEAPNLFRPISQQCISEEILATEFFGEGATKFLAHLLSRNPPKGAEVIEKLVDEEFSKGYQSKPKTASQKNAKFGVGGWRPMPLRVWSHVQSNPREVRRYLQGGMPTEFIRRAGSPDARTWWMRSGSVQSHQSTRVQM